MTEPELFDERRVTTSSEVATYCVEVMDFVSSESPTVTAFFMTDWPYSAVRQWTQLAVSEKTDRGAEISLLVESGRDASGPEYFAVILERIQNEAEQANGE